MKRFVLMAVIAMLVMAAMAFGQDYEKASLLFGYYHDVDAKDGGYQNWSPFIGASIPLTGRFYGIMGGEFAQNEIGNEYSVSPIVIAYVGEQDWYITPSIHLNGFLMLGPDVTWADIGTAEDYDLVTYFLTATGFGGTLGIGDRAKIWGAYQHLTNPDYAVSRVGLGVRWAFF